MREVIAKRLGIGNAGDSRVEAFVNVAADELSPTLPRDIVYCHFPLLDGSGNSPTLLNLAIETITSLLDGDMPVLVYCGAGMSRSVAVSAAAIARWRGQPLQETLAEITSNAPHDISPALYYYLKDR